MNLFSSILTCCFFLLSTFSSYFSVNCSGATEVGRRSVKMIKVKTKHDSGLLEVNNRATHSTDSVMYSNSSPSRTCDGDLTTSNLLEPQQEERASVSQNSKIFLF